MSEKKRSMSMLWGTYEGIWAFLPRLILTSPSTHLTFLLLDFSSSTHHRISERGMSESGDAPNWSDMNDYEISSQQSYQGLPSFILETMSDYSVPSPRMHSDELQAYEDEFREEIALLNESPGSARAARLQAIANKQKGRLEDAELDIATYSQHQTVAENTNSALADRLAGISTEHVLVCLERDGLRRFKMIAIYVIVVLAMVIVLGFVAYVWRILHP